MSFQVVYNPPNQKKTRLVGSTQPLESQPRRLFTKAQTQLEPIVYLQQADMKKRYTLVMYDPDAPSPSFLHWLLVNIPGGLVTDADVVASYYPPSPPSGTHRYIFKVYEQGSQQTLQLPKIQTPQGRSGFNIEAFLTRFFPNQKPLATAQFLVAA